MKKEKRGEKREIERMGGKGKEKKEGGGVESEIKVLIFM